MAVHWLPRSVGRKRAGKFKHAGIFWHDPVIIGNCVYSKWEGKQTPEYFQSEVVLQANSERVLVGRPSPHSTGHRDPLHDHDGDHNDIDYDRVESGGVHRRECACGRDGPQELQIRCV